jgi:hypothetical protein
MKPRHPALGQGAALCLQVVLASWWVDGETNRAFQKEAPLMKERGKKSEIKSRVAANFVGWEKDHALFDRELDKVIRALRTDEGGREKPPASRL